MAHNDARWNDASTFIFDTDTLWVTRYKNTAAAVNTHTWAWHTISPNGQQSMMPV